MKPIHLNLYIVDDDAVLCRSLVSLLNAHFSEFSVRTFASGESFLEGADLDSNGVVIMDLRMEPGISGLEVFKQMQDQKSALVLIFLSGHGTIPDAVRAMEGGAVSWLAKPCTNEELIAVVQRAKDRATRTARQRQSRQHALSLWSGLTAREKQTAIPAAQGKTSKQISRDFAAKGIDIDPRTIERHRANAMSKLAVPNTNALQALILENDLDKELIPASSKRKKAD